MYRYFYNAQGQIVGYTVYHSRCAITQMDGATNWIDHPGVVDVINTVVDINTQTLVPAQN